MREVERARNRKVFAIKVTKLQLDRYYASLKWKEIIPDEIDMEVLSEAICLKREGFQVTNSF